MRAVRRRVDGRGVAVALAAAAALAQLPLPGTIGSLAAQEPRAGGAGRDAPVVPAPSIHAAWHRQAAEPHPRLTLTVAPPAGWELYAPREAGTRWWGEGGQGSPGRPRPGRPLLGRPLAVVVPGGDGVGVRDVLPAPVASSQAGGLAFVYDGPVRLSLDPLPAGVRRLEVRWALCREDRCVPGATGVPVPDREPERD